MVSTSLHSVVELNLERALQPELTLEEGLEICEFAHQLDPDSLTPFMTGITVYEQRGRTDLAGPWLDRALARFPLEVVLLRARALVCELEGNPDFALSYWNRAIALDPLSDPDGSEVARVYMNMARLDEAIPRFARAVEGFHGHGGTHETRVIRLYGDALLKAGDASGFIHYLKRLEYDCGYYQIANLPWWAGEPLQGKRVFLTHQLGFGDQFLLAAIVPRLREQGCEVFLTVDDLTYELIGTSIGPYYVRPDMRACVTGLEPSAALQAWVDELKPDIQATLLHLPTMAQALGIAPSEFFRPYMIVPENVQGGMAPSVAKIREEAAGRIIVGVAWDCVQRTQFHIHGAYAARFADRRSVPTSMIATLTDDPEIRERYYFVSLTHDTHYAQFEGPLPENMSHLGQALSSFAATAAVIENCDFVISIDMSVSNLSCAMGKETWVLLQHEGEWRFGVTGDDSPWLRCAKAFRQRIPFDWAGVLANVRKALLPVNNT